MIRNGWIFVVKLAPVSVFIELVFQPPGMAQHAHDLLTVRYFISFDCEQVYSTQLLVHAEFSGLRHIMYHHPWLSTTAGILSNILILTVIMLISWTRYDGSYSPASCSSLGSGVMAHTCRHHAHLWNQV